MYLNSRKIIGFAFAMIIISCSKEYLLTDKFIINNKGESDSVEDHSVEVNSDNQLPEEVNTERVIVLSGETMYQRQYSQSNEEERMSVELSEEGSLSSAIFFPTETKFRQDQQLQSIEYSYSGQIETNSNRSSAILYSENTISGNKYHLLESD